MSAKPKADTLAEQVYITGGLLRVLAFSLPQLIEAAGIDTESEIRFSLDAKTISTVTLERLLNGLRQSTEFFDGQYVLLDASDIHKPGDEVYASPSGWQPLPAIHYGDAVGEDSAPCRRRITL